MPMSTLARRVRVTAGLIFGFALLVPTGAGSHGEPPGAVAAPAWQATPVTAPPLTSPDPAAPSIAPPPIGGMVLEDALLGPGVAPVGECPTGRASLRFADKGYLAWVSGPCVETLVEANVAAAFGGLTIPDGEVRFDVRPLSGHDRLRLRIGVRVQADPSFTAGYAARLTPAEGLAELVKQTSDRRVTLLAQRADLAGLLPPGTWTTVAVRADGPRLWLLIEGQPVLSAVDMTFETGGVVVILSRTGEARDGAEASVLLRNLRVSGLAGGDPSRAPVYRPPPPDGRTGDGGG